MQDTNMVSRAARWSATHRRTAIFGWIAFVIAAIALGGAVGQKKMTEADQYPGESGRGQQALQDARLTPNTEMLLVQGKDAGTTARTPEFRSAVEDLSTRLKSAPHVKAVRSPLRGESPVARDGRTALVQYDVAGNLEEAQDRVGATEKVVRSVAAEHPEVRVEQYGAASAHVQLSDTIDRDLHKAEAISMPITLLILLFACGTLVAAGLPLILAFSAVIATMSLVALPSQIFPVNDNVASIILLVGLAVGVDYALFYLRREREERANGHSPSEALAIAAATSGHAVFISGLTVMAAMVGMFLTGDNMFTSLASGATLVVAIAMVASISVLPAVMSWLGDRLDRGRVPRLRLPRGRRRRAATPRPARRGVWPVVIDRVMRRPLLALLAAAGVLVALSVPVLGMNAQVTAITDLPKDVSTMQAYHHISAAFPGEAAKAAVVVAAGDARHGEADSGIAALRDRAEATHVAIGDVRTSYSADGRTALVDIPIAGTGSDEQSTAAVKTLRDDIVPATIGRVDGAAVDVTGDAAKSLDEDAVMSHSLPIVFGFVLSLTFLLMLFTFRSIVIPLGTIVLNMLSVGAAYGVLVLVFQHGWGESLLGFESNGGITSWLPLFLFVILFGLSMDYHMFILSRVREAYDKGMSTDDAIRHGISSTAGTVTSAAIVMVAVFAAFATLSFVDMKEMGVGLAAAVLIDATLIRGVLLPAGMKLLGDRTWYLPRLLHRTPLGRRRAAQPEPARA
jgi:RND superfamily putative drug exporter